MIGNNANKTAIRCENLSKRFGAVTAVSTVTLNVQAEHFFALLGPSGCGKTTVLRMIAGLETPDSGEIEIGDRIVSSSTVSILPEQRRIGMVFQEYALFPHLTVHDNTAFGLQEKEGRHERIHQVLSLVGLEGLKDRMPHELSGGQQQRVALARALAPRPDLILLDEPFSNLDAALRGRVRQEVRAILRKASVTAIFVTHDQEEALSLADEVAVMIDGQIMQADPPERLYRRPTSHRVATFLGEANFLPGTAQGTRVACELGALTITEPLQGDVEIMFRPEDLILTACADGPGTIIDRTYFGHDQLMTVQMNTQTTLKARQLGCCRGLRTGQRVRLDVTPSAVMAYPSHCGCPVTAPPQR